jgi:excisionase family DNA binding protein
MSFRLGRPTDIRRDPPATGEESPEASAEARDLPPILTVDELAALLRINRKTCYEALSRREIPGARKIGRTIRISRDAVLEWLAGQGRVSGRK